MDKNKTRRGALERVRRVIADVLQVDAEAVTLQADFRRDLGADSLDMVELTLALEREFQADVFGHIDPSWDETLDVCAQEINTVADLVGYLELLAPLCCSRPIMSQNRLHERELALRAYLSQSSHPQEQVLAMLMTGNLDTGERGWLG